MNPFELTIIGSGSALPMRERHASSQYLHIASRHILIDCAEGTQLRLQELKISPMKLDTILISHLHGDHYYGLIGLINSMHLNGRTNPLKIYGPPELINILNLMLKASDTHLRYPLHFHALEPIDGQILDLDNHLRITSFRVKHRIPAWGFRFDEILGRKINKDFIAAFQPIHEDLQHIQAGGNFTTAAGEVLSNETITHLAHPSRSYAYCTDTAYFEALIDRVFGVNLLYHEATFGKDMVDFAEQTFHSTTVQAAEIALRAEVGKLLIGHFSSRYKNPEVLLDEAKTVFESTELALDDKKFLI
ncbi:MAG: ribonuclease Z [Bacteroidales bacterium]|nr:ribonuclease Z [Bacteroidales bacterium]MDY0086780.1 ribonuclease Z [Bacteroidales bacterium]HOI31577.1 ribonuclease Z [Bacteroidales bacterium]